MQIKRIRCPYCSSKYTKKKGKQSGRIRYECNECGRRFQSKKRQNHVEEDIWYRYTHGKQTLEEIAKVYTRSTKWVRNKLDNREIPKPKDIPPTEIIVVPDTTFWGRSYGVCVFRSWTHKENIWWSEVPSERVAHYYYGRKILEDRGWIFKATVIDGRRGLATVFKDIPVQTCHFHQLQTVTRYLTRRPKTDAGRELRSIALTLTNTTEKEFRAKLIIWEKKWKDFINERSYTHGNSFHYTHRSVRSAFHSLKRNLPTLFTYQKYPELNIPNTTNTIDGYFASVKKKTAAHHGLRRDRRFKVISELLRGK